MGDWMAIFKHPLNRAVEDALILPGLSPMDAISEYQARANQHLFQADGGALQPPAHDHHHQPGLPGVAELPGQPGAG